jgi:hypothetical protein
MKKLAVLLALSFNLLTISAAFASTTFTVYNNIDSTDSGFSLWPGNSSTGYLAQSFSTGAEPFDLTKVTMKLKHNPFPPTGNNFSVELYSDAGNQVGTPLYTIASAQDSSLDQNSYAPVTFTLTTVQPLLAATRYWIVLKGSTSDASWAPSRDMNTIGVSTEYIYDGHAYWSTDMNAPSNNGTPGGYLMDISTIVPEPSTYALLCLSLGVVGYTRKKMTKAVVEA